MKPLKTISVHIIEHGTDVTRFDEPPIVSMGENAVHLCKLYVCGKIPLMAFSRIEKCYWENDINGLNQLIDKLANEGTKISRIKFHKDSWVLEKYGIGTGKYLYHSEYGEITLSQITKGDIFIGVDEEGDLVYAKL